MLLSAAAPEATVAGHLLRCAPEGDAEVSALLQRMAHSASEHGDPGTAVRCWERALEEHALADARPRLLARRALAALDAAHPGALSHLLDAHAQACDATDRLELAARLGDFGRGGDAAEASPAGDAVREAAALDVLATGPATAPERAQRAQAADPSGDPVLQRAFLAHRAWAAVQTGAPSAEVAELARRALADDLLLDDAGRRAGFHLAVRVLIAADRHAAAAEAIAALRTHAATTGSPRLAAQAAAHAASLARRRGLVDVGERAPPPGARGSPIVTRPGTFGMRTAMTHSSAILYVAAVQRSSS